MKEPTADYRELRSATASPALSPSSPPLSEKDLQSFWQSPALRGKTLTLADGSLVDILDPGSWNRSGGPDFRNALLGVGALVRRGDVELHLRPADWDVHAHSPDPAYGNVILHVTWSDTPPAKTLPPGIPSLVLSKQSNLFPAPGATPRGTLPTDSVRPCQLALASRPETLDALLVGAGRFRLEVKARVFAGGVQTADAFQCFYEALLVAMGYGGNAESFRRLAREVPFERIRALDSPHRLAVLAGYAGLLNESRRTLWDMWWQSAVPPPLTPIPWKKAGMRPQNHPLRRLTGAVGVLNGITSLFALPLSRLPEALVKGSAILGEWIGTSGALIGEARASAVVNNVFAPYRLALGELPLSALDRLPSESESAPMRETWLALTGSERALPQDGLRQQALLQLNADFCRNPDVGCAFCPIVRKLREGTL